MPLVRRAPWRKRAGAAHARFYVHAIEQMKKSVAEFLENPEQSQAETDTNRFNYLVGNLKSRKSLQD